MEVRVRQSMCAALACLVGVAGCSTRYYPPPVAPSRSVPAVVTETVTPREGEGLVTLDTVGIPARVDVVTQRTQVLGVGRGYYPQRTGAMLSAEQLTSRPLCTTPCTAALTLGQQELLFTALDPTSNRTSTSFVSVGRRPSVARHALGFQETHISGVIGGLVLGLVGLGGALAGGMLLGFSGMQDDRSADRTDFVTTGGITLGVGLGLIATSLWIGLRSRPEHQPGATTQWTPDDAVAPVP